MSANPYLEARREWDERYADLVLGKRNWRMFICSFAACAKTADHWR
jgi:type IV secretory pathway TrbF-like protein